MKSSKAKFGIGLGILLVIGFVGMYIIPSLKNELTLDQRGQRTTAQIKSENHNNSFRSVSYYYLTVAYFDAYRQVQSANVHVAYSYFSQVQPGDWIDITYDPQDPSNARLADQSQSDPLWRRAMYMFSLAAVFIAIGAGIVALWRRRKNR